MGQRLGIAAPCWATPVCSCSTSRSTASIPEGIRWVRLFLRGLAAEGRTVFVSSHLISEMALTADRLIVIGRGRLIAETSVADFVARSGGGAVRLLTPGPGRVHCRAPAGRGHGRAMATALADRRGTDAPQIGDLAARDGLRVHELTPDHCVIGGRLHGTDPRRSGVPPVDDGRPGCGRLEGVMMTTDALLDAPWGTIAPSNVAKSELAKDPYPAFDRHHTRPHVHGRPVGDGAGSQRRLAPQPRLLPRLRPDPKRR